MPTPRNQTPTSPPRADADAPLLKIQEVAAETGLTTPRRSATTRRCGLLEPAARSEGAYRLYDASDLERLRYIKELRDEAGFSLAQIGQLLEDEAARERNRERFRASHDPTERRAILETRASASSARSRPSRRRPYDSPTMIEAARETAAPTSTSISRSSTAAPTRIPSAGVRGPMTGVTLPRRRAASHGRKAAAPFGHRNYRLFFGGQAISLVGTWMQQVAQGWLVLTLTGDPFWLGVVATAQFLPVMILGLFAGVLADVLPKRQTLHRGPGDDDGARGRSSPC